MNRIVFMGFLLVFFIPVCMNSQAKFVPGYLISDKGDTLKGEVKVNPKKEHDLYLKVMFKDAAGTQKNWKPAKIKGYGFDGRHFISVKNNDEDMFFQRLTDGNIILFKAAYEVIVMNESSYDFEYYVMREGDTKHTEVKENKFKKQMSDWMKDNPEFISDFKDEKKFNAEAAAEVINRYNAWKKNN